MRTFWKVIAGIIGGLIVAILGSAVFGLTFGGSENGSAVGVAFFVLWAISLAIAILSESGGRAWRKLFFISAALSFALPLSSLVFGGRAVIEAEGGAEAVGTAIGGGLIAVFTGFVGFFLGLVFLVLGFVTGRTGPTQVIIKDPGD